VLAEEAEDVIVLLPGEPLAECLDVLQEVLDGSLQRKRFVFFGKTGEFEAAFLGVKFEALALLRLDRFGGGVAGGGAKPPAVLAPFDQEAAAGRPLDAALRIPP